MWNILYCSSSPFLGKLLFVHTQPMLGVSHTYRGQYIFLNHVLCYWFCKVINHAGIAACPSVTPDHLAEADRAPHPRRSRSQPETLPKTKWPCSVAGRKPLPEDLCSAVSSSPGSARPSAPSHWCSRGSPLHFFLKRLRWRAAGTGCLLPWLVSLVLSCTVHPCALASWGNEIQLQLRAVLTLEGKAMSTSGARG